MGGVVFPNPDFFLVTPDGPNFNFFMASCTTTTLTKLDRGGEENVVQIVVAGGNISLDLDELLSSCDQGLWD